MEMATCPCTVTCTANTSVFILDAKNYDRLVVKKNPNTIQKLRYGTHRKLHSRLSTTNGGLVPLFKVVYDKLSEELRPKVKQDCKRIKVDDDKNNKLALMVKLYLMDKGPLLDPLLPDSFQARLLSERRNKLLEKRINKKIEDAALQRQRRHRVARSIKQLQSSAAETELLHPEGSWVQPVKPSKDRHVRPKTALGIEHRSDNDSSLFRPETTHSKSSVFHLTECESSEDTGQNVGKARTVLVTQEFDHMFQQIDHIQV